MAKKKTKRTKIRTSHANTQNENCYFAIYTLRDQALYRL